MSARRRRLSRLVRIALLASAWAGLAAGARAEPVRNGNELALAYVEGKAADKAKLAAEKTGVIHTFRYLKITGILRDQPEAGRFTFTTVEPSSDMKVRLVVRHKLSLQLAGTLQTNDCVTANGRVTEIGKSAPDLIVVDPAVLKAKDRPAPKVNNELLNEIDPTAH